MTTETAESLSSRLVEARRARRALNIDPHTIPGDEAGAYAVQDRCLALMPAAGWKVGNVAPGKRHGLGLARFCGPAPTVYEQSPDMVAEVIPGGFCAFELEMIVVLAEDVAPDAGTNRSAGCLRRLVAGLYAGVEIAGSPVPTILDLGPLGAICDHGNCLGIGRGPELDPALLSGEDGLNVLVEVEGTVVGRGKTASLPGGPLASLAFLLENLAARGIALSAGTAIATGALTGVHEARSGLTAIFTFGDLPPFTVTLR